MKLLVLLAVQALAGHQVRSLPGGIHGSLQRQLSAVQPHLSDNAAVTRLVNQNLAAAAGAHPDVAAAAYVLGRAVVEPGADRGLDEAQQAGVRSVREAFERDPQAREGLLAAITGLQARMGTEELAGRKTALDGFYGEQGLALSEEPLVWGGGIVSAEKLALARLKPHKFLAFRAEAYIAADKSNPDYAGRMRMVQELGRLSLREAEGSLRYIAYAPSGGSRDYAIREEALRILHRKGLTLPKPEISDEYVAELVRDWVRELPLGAAFDYDRTLMPSGQELDRDTAERLARLSRLMTTMVLTARAAESRTEIAGDVGILEMFKNMTTEEKSRLLVGAECGARIFGFSRGRHFLLDESEGWTQKQVRALFRATQNLKHTAVFDEHSYTVFVDLPDADLAKLGTPQEKRALAQEAGEAALEQIRGRLRREGHAFQFTLFIAKKDGKPFIMITRNDKSLGVRRLRRLQARMRVMDALGRRVPAGWEPAARKLGAGVPFIAPRGERRFVTAGDDHLLPDGVDHGMAYGDVQALAVGQVHPMSRALPWRRQGVDGTKDIIAMLERAAALQLARQRGQAVDGAVERFMQEILGGAETRPAFAN